MAVISTGEHFVVVINSCYNFLLFICPLILCVLFPFSVNWVTVDGILYKKPCAVVIELGEDPVFPQQ